MKPDHRDRALESSGVQDSASFEIDADESAHLMVILRDTLYSDKIMAVEREYFANAWDANRSNNNGHVPVKVTLPTPEHRVFTIRDNGPGISREDIFKVFVRYGKSTKRDDNNSVGMLGIGSKSGFAYSDSFTVTSWNGGWKRVYVAVLDNSDKGRMNMLHEEECGEETGVMIEIPVEVADIPDFRAKAKTLYRHVRPVPEINIDLDVPPGETVLENGVLYIPEENDYGFGPKTWTAVMGCVPYRIDISKVAGLEDYPYLNNISGVLFFDIGSVQINASREELKYSDSTKRAITEKVEAVVDEFVLVSLQRLHALNISTFEKRLRFRILEKLKLPFSKDTELMQEYIKFPPFPPTFRITRRGEDDADKFYVHRNARFLFKDDVRSLKGFSGLTDYDYLVRKTDQDTEWDEIEKDLEKYLADMKIDGVRQEHLSTMSWFNPRGFNGRGKTYNANHRYTVFTLKKPDSGYFRAPYSKFWQKADANETKQDDVYIVIEHFKAKGWERFYDRYAADSKLLRALGIPMPTVYGYKSTDKKPVDVASIIARPYKDWSENLHDAVLTPKVKSLVDLHFESEKRPNLDVIKSIKAVTKALGPSHDISVAITRQQEARDVWDGLEAGLKNAIEEVEKRFEKHVVPTGADYVHLRKKYPLIFMGLYKTNLKHLFDEDTRFDWLEYINLVDFVHGMKARAA